MEENSEFKDCKTWEERLYWKHFNSMHFCLQLPSDFHHHLKLPEKFAAHMKAQLPNKVSLKGPSGVTWEIDLLKSDDLFFVGNEWKCFVKANELRENCFLVFKFERTSNFKVLIFDQRGSCEKESAYFVKKCWHSKSDDADTKKRTVREVVSSTEVIEVENGEDNSDHVATKKSRRDDGALFSSGGRVKTSTARKRVPSVAAKSRGRPRRVVLPRKTPNKPEVLPRKIRRRNTPANEVSQNTKGDKINMITPENGDNLPGNDHVHESEFQSEKSKEANQIFRELITPQNGENSLVDNHSLMQNGQSEKQLENDAAKESRDHNITGDGESLRAIDVFQNSESKSEKRPRKSEISKELSQIPEKGLNTPERGEYTPLTEKELSCRSSAKMIRPNHRESSIEEDRPFKSSGKRGRGRGRSQPKTQMLPKSSKNLVFNSEIVSNKGRFSKEYMSNRRPVTEMEKDTTFQRACQNQTEGSFSAIMRPSSVYKRFFLSVPGDWLYKYLPMRNQEVILRVGEKTWHTMLVNYGRKSAGFSTGWKKFAVENNLEEFDVLVFKLVSKKNDEAVVMDVDIFREVDRIIPLIPINPEAQ